MTRFNKTILQKRK